MKTVKITEKAHENLMKAQYTFYKITGKKLTFSEIIERFFIKDLSEDEYK